MGLRGDRTLNSGENLLRLYIIIIVYRTHNTTEHTHQTTKLYRDRMVIMFPHTEFQHDVNYTYISEQTQKSLRLLDVFKQSTLRIHNHSGT